MKKTKLNSLTLKQTISLLNTKQISLEQIYDDVYQAIGQQEHLNAYLTLIDKNTAIKQAKLNQQLPLNGLPIAVKDNFLTKNFKTTASSKILADFMPPFESSVTQKLQQAGGVIIGKTNLDAWAHGSSTETSDFGRTVNPRNTDYLPGGSSGGSAAAVAADMCLAAIGSETAGSIRQPAAWCGVVGLKPTYGRVSRYGVVAMASSTDSPGPITKTVEDAAILLNHIAGHDPNDATCNPKPIPDFTANLDQEIKNLKIGILYSEIQELQSVNQILNQKAKIFEKLGAKVDFAQAMDPKLAISIYTIVQRSEVSSNLSRYTGIRYGKDRTHFGAEAKRRIILGTFSLSKGYADKYYETAQKVRTLFIQDFTKLFKQFDVLISPTSPGYAKKIGVSEGQAMFGELEDMLLEPSSLTGLPGISVPMHHDLTTNLYLGMNIMAPMWREDLILKVAHAFEQAQKNSYVYNN